MDGQVARVVLDLAGGQRARQLDESRQTEQGMVGQAVAHGEGTLAEVGMEAVRVEAEQLLLARLSSGRQGGGCGCRAHAMDTSRVGGGATSGRITSCCRLG